MRRRSETLPYWWLITHGRLVLTSYLLVLCALLVVTGPYANYTYGPRALFTEAPKPPAALFTFSPAIETLEAARAPCSPY